MKDYVQLFVFEIVQSPLSTINGTQWTSVSRMSLSINGAVVETQDEVGLNFLLARFLEDKRSSVNQWAGALFGEDVYPFNSTEAGGENFCP